MSLQPFAIVHNEAGQAPVSALPSDPRRRQYQSVSRAILPPRIGQIQMYFIGILATE